MDFIIGGAFQGKKTFAREHFGLNADDIFTCKEDAAPDWNRRCIEHIERYVLYCIKNGMVPELNFRSDAVVIGDDIFCGVVPIDTEIRAWREETGRFYGRISQTSQSVHRLFCGLPLKLK